MPGTEFDPLRLRDSASVVSILRPSLVVGTGMTGILMKMACGISRGTYYNVKGNESRLSVVHALDVARMVRLVEARGGDYSFSDGQSPLVSDLAEALSVRIDHKRIPMVSPRLARYLSYIGFLTGGVTPEMLRYLTADHLTVDSENMKSLESFIPRNVVEYLTTHQYTEEDI